MRANDNHEAQTEKHPNRPPSAVVIRNQFRRLTITLRIMNILIAVTIAIICIKYFLDHKKDGHFIVAASVPAICVVPLDFVQIRNWRKKLDRPLKAAEIYFWAPSAIMAPIVMGAGWGYP
jgi:hypothetical protein